jgi:hypothetical protein
VTVPLAENAKRGWCTAHDPDKILEIGDKVILWYTPKGSAIRQTKETRITGRDIHHDGHFVYKLENHKGQYHACYLELLEKVKTPEKDSFQEWLSE